MSEKPKPFVFYTSADGYPSEYNWDIVIGGVRVGTRFTDPDGNHGHAVEQAAELIRMAVEQREARLRGVLADAYAALRDLVNVANNVGPVEAGSAVWHHAVRVSADIVAIGADGVPAYVPRAELDAANEKVKQLQAAIDALEPGRYATGEQVAAWLEANGLKKPPARDGHALADLVNLVAAIARPPE